MRPTTKKVARVHCAASASSTARVCARRGPSSKVSTTSRSASSGCPPSWVAKRGPVPVSISTVRATPSTSGRSAQGCSAAAGVREAKARTRRAAEVVADDILLFHAPPDRLPRLLPRCTSAGKRLPRRHNRHLRRVGARATRGGIACTGGHRRGPALTRRGPRPIVTADCAARRRTDVDAALPLPIGRRGTPRRVADRRRPRFRLRALVSGARSDTTGRACGSRAGDGVHAEHGRSA